MLSLAGLLIGCAGSGEGAGSAMTPEVALAVFAVLVDAPTASAKPLRDRPPSNATAKALVATFLKCLDIIPSSGIAAELPTYAVRIKERFRASRTTRQSSGLSKLNEVNFVQGTVTHSLRSRLVASLRIWVIAFPD